MNFIRKFLNAGIFPDTSLRLARGIKLTNFFTFIVINLQIIYSLIYMAFGVEFLELIFLLFILVNIPVFYLNTRRYYITAKLVFLINVNVLTYIFTTYCGIGIDGKLFFFATFSTAFLLFNLQDKKNITALIITLLLPIIGFCAIEIIRPSGMLHLSGLEFTVLKWSNIISFIICTSLQLIYFRHLFQLTLNKLEESNLQLQALLNNMLEGILLQNDKGDGIRTNQSALSILGLSEEQLFGKTPFDRGWKLINPDGSLMNYKQIPCFVTLATGKAVISQVMGVKHTDGNLRWVSASSAPIYSNDSDKPFQIISTFHDITEIKNSEMKLHHTAKLASLGEMAASIAHEINNPLSVIMGNSYLLKNELISHHISSGAPIEHLKTIDSTVNRITSIIQGLRIFAKGEDYNQKPIDQFIKQIIDDTILLCNFRFSFNNVTFKLASIPDDLFLQCRPTQISQVILNLLNNSFDAIRDLPEKWIEINATSVDNNIQIRFTDSGTGINKELAQKIFVPFFSTKGPGHGTGMGLSISSGIIKSHHGTIELDHDHKNTSFIITLPKEQPI